ncbi:hypothetical protein CBM2587_B80273 [Cupriavidus taiwanensis]|uniref:Uncharacterized protein n=1 Tax=Cupriavidus taiwanensis TaxID=164546 RepID=A0A375CBP1_9BURK|nr:hypothetical protein CBM2587_B80273 [Cupriavidus taiwanensis]
MINRHSRTSGDMGRTVFGEGIEDSRDRRRGKTKSAGKLCESYSQSTPTSAGKTKPAAFHPGGRTYGRFFNAALTGRNYRTAVASNQPLA